MENCHSMKDNLAGVFTSSDTRTKKSLYGSPLLPKIMQKPIGIGSFVGFLTGVANSLILSIPLHFSLPAGVLLGIIVCVVACPGMRNDLVRHKQVKQENRKELLARKGRRNAFTMHE